MRLLEALQRSNWPSSEYGNVLCIIEHESSGDPCVPSAYNAGGGESSWGLMQINLKAHTQWTVAQVTDPIFNLNAGYQLYQGRGGNYLDWSVNCSIYGLPPVGNTRHAVSERQALADRELSACGGADSSGGGLGDLPVVGPILASLTDQDKTLLLVAAAAALLLMDD